MNRSSFGFILIACIYSISINTVVGFGANCTDDANCTENVEVCNTSNGTCVCNTNNKYYYNGNKCDLDECSPNRCQHGGTCSDNVNGYTCNCVDGYTGTDCGTDVNECSSNPCGQNGACEDGVNGYVCNCDAGYTGTQCELNVNECSSNPCGQNGACEDGVNRYVCNCDAGYTGTHCELNVNECSSNPCGQNGACEDGVNGYVCNCDAGYTGTHCEINVNECLSNPCGQNGACEDGVNRYVCNCDAGYTGTLCELNVNECSSNPCGQNGACEDGVNRYVCNCNAGYSGTHCEINVNECSSNPCGQNGACKDGVNRYVCNCDAGYTGTRCELNVNECSSNPCGQNGACEDGVNRYVCNCDAGYTGTHCEYNIDDCKDAPCLNGGKCTDEVADFSCTCQTGFSSKTCADAALGASCAVYGTSCKNLNAECGSGQICRCTNSYYDSDGTNNIGGTCLQRKQLGTSCSGFQDECADSAADCLNGKCTCGPQYYDSTGFTPGGICLSIGSLKVKEISFPADSVTTSGFKVHWTQPDMATYVNSYVIEWKPKSTDNNFNGGNGNVASSGTFFVINTGVTAGKTYTVTVTSKNTQTQSNVPRTTSLSKEQAAKPGIPGPIDKDRSDFHASDVNSGISLYWTRPSGGVSGYKIEVSDGTNSQLSNVTSADFTFRNSWLKNGHRYNVTIQAKSETYGSGNGFVLGEEYREEIKTVVTEPSEPRNVTCKDIFDESIVLEWQSPLFPNGDLVRYTVKVTKSQQANLYTISTSGVTYTLTVENLEPGTWYTFRVFTENEGHNSTTHGEKTCQTKAKLSDPPSNLTVTSITSRNFTVHWDKPNNTHSEENYGYVIQTKIGEACIKEVVYRCIDCREVFKSNPSVKTTLGKMIKWSLTAGGLCLQPSMLENMCANSLREVFNRTKNELAGQQLWQFLSLLPDTMYSISVTAVNSRGRGNVADIAQSTKEEVPQAPYSVQVSAITRSSFVVEWTIAGDRPGKTNFTVSVTADSPAPSKNIVVEGFTTRKLPVENLEEFWSYVVTVEAATSVGSAKSSPTARQQTLPAAPGQVSDFQISDAPGGNYTQMKVTWKAPETLQRNSIIKEYKFEYYSDKNSGILQSLQYQHKANDTYQYTVSVYVRPEQTYTVQVFAVNTEDENGEKTIKNKKAPAGVPINIEETMGVDIIPKQSVKNRGETRFTVSITEEFFTESTYGDIRATGLVACAKQCDDLDIKRLSDFNSMDNWQKARTSVYRVTEAKWRENLQVPTTTGARRKREVTEIEYTVGSDTCSNVGEDQYCNGPLQPDTSYMLFAVSCTNGGCLVSNQYGPFITLAEPEKSSLGMIVGIVVAVVVVLAVVSVIGFIMIRRRQRGPGGMKPAPNDDDEEFTGIDPAIAKIPRKRPVVLSEIEEYVTNMHKDSNLLFSSEYEDLKTLSPKHSCEAADKEENRMRNRYINIIPFDHSRVKLSTNGEDDSSDYINANYLPGYTSPREYIGCQGPIPGTIDDFWRMVWEQNVSVIVMLTLCKEGQKIKCEQYWPDEVGEPKQYGDVVVEINSYSNIRTYDYRMFKITSGNKTRVIKHFHFLSWLDFQANVHHDIILDFIQHVRQHVQPPDTSGPMIIHCSAGVGRTGTYIVLDHLIQFIYDHDFDVSIDIFDMVLKLRENRMHMVQTEQQYVFIHDCVNEIMNRKRRETDNIYVNQAFSSDENIYQNDENLYANVAKGSSEQNTEL